MCEHFRTYIKIFYHLLFEYNKILKKSKNNVREKEKKTACKHELKSPVISHASFQYTVFNINKRLVKNPKHLQCKKRGA